MDAVEVQKLAEAIAKANRHPTPQDWAAAVTSAYTTGEAYPEPTPDEAPEEEAPNA